MVSHNSAKGIRLILDVIRTRAEGGVSKGLIFVLSFGSRSGYDWRMRSVAPYKDFGNTEGLAQ